MFFVRFFSFCLISTTAFNNTARAQSWADIKNYATSFFSQTPEQKQRQNQINKINELASKMMDSHALFFDENILNVQSSDRDLHIVKILIDHKILLGLYTANKDLISSNSKTEYLFLKLKLENARALAAAIESEIENISAPFNSTTSIYLQQLFDAETLEVAIKRSRDTIINHLLDIKNSKSSFNDLFKSADEFGIQFLEIPNLNTTIDG